MVGWNEAAGAHVRGEATIRDVCADCNNVKLATLDAYGKRFLTEAGVLVPNYTKLSITLKYDFDLMARWLLKLGYNAARIDGTDPSVFTNYIAYILGIDARPQNGSIAIVASMAAPEHFTDMVNHDSGWEQFGDTTRRYNPYMTRLSVGLTRFGNNFHMRMIFFGPLVLHVLIFEDGVLPGHAAVKTRKLVKVNPGSVHLLPGLRLAFIRAGHRTWRELLDPRRMNPRWGQIKVGT